MLGIKRSQDLLASPLPLHQPVAVRDLLRQLCLLVAHAS
jgi:hypothetical protein